MELASGAMVTHNVRLVQPLGQGGMGSVWIAEHLGLEARVAVKFIDADLVKQDPSLKERFKREASICARLRSIHAVQTFDHGVTESGTPYIVMELLEGTDLTHQITVNGTMSLAETAVVVDQVAKVLHRAHVLGVVHRDIKPDNIFLTDSEYDIFVKVLDFGIAKQTRIGDKRAAVTKTGAVIGTPEFMSPEQAIGSKSIDHRSDLFSLAVVAYFALTADLPFDPDLAEPLWFQMTRGMHIPVRKLRPALPPALDQWFEVALEPNPDRRFQSAKELAERLNKIAAGQGKVVTDPAPTSSGNYPIDDEQSYPAQYDLYGPDSTDFEYHEATVLMNADDHSRAEADGEGPPTVPRPLAGAPGPDRAPATPRPAAGAPAAVPKLGRTITLSSADAPATPGAARPATPEAAHPETRSPPTPAATPPRPLPPAPPLDRELEPLVPLPGQPASQPVAPARPGRLLALAAFVIAALVAAAILLLR